LPGAGAGRGALPATIPPGRIAIPAKVASAADRPPGGVRPLLEVRDLAKRYGPVVALDGATFTARPGRLVGFLGPNGAGKTTAMRCIFGLARPDRGEVHWNGRRIDRTARLRFGYMPEQRGLYPRMKVGEQISYFAQHHGMRSKAADAAARAWLERLGLGDRAASKLEDLSHGNQQRVQLAVALAHEPELLVLDEPFSGLDPIGIATMTEVLRDRVEQGVGVVFSSHQLDLVEDICEDVVIISKGRIVADGQIDDLKAGSGRRHLEVEVDGADGSWLAGRTDVQVVEMRGSRFRLLVDESANLSGLLAAAEQAGPVRRFSYEPPALSELFMEVIER
jgi:ABC-2 type transport system ATP-binding protein